MSTPMKEYLLVFIFSTFCHNAAQAYYPFITDDTGTQGSGGHQLELAYEGSRERRDILTGPGGGVGREKSESSVLPITYTYGITEDVDIFLGLMRQNSPVHGWQNTELGIKWAVAGSQKEGWSLGIKPAIVFPVSERARERGLGNDKTNWSLTAIATYLTEDHELHLNAGAASNRNSRRPEEAARRSLWSASVAPVIVLNDQWKFGVEAGLQTNPDYVSKTTAFVGAGLVYAPAKDIQIGSALHAFPAVNARDNSRSTVATIGLTTQF